MTITPDRPAAWAGAVPRPVPTAAPVPSIRSRAVVILDRIATRLAPGIAGVGWVFGAPVRPSLMRQRCLRLSSVLDEREDRR